MLREAWGVEQMALHAGDVVGLVQRPGEPIGDGQKLVVIIDRGGELYLAVLDELVEVAVRTA